MDVGPGRRGKVDVLVTLAVRKASGVLEGTVSCSKRGSKSMMVTLTLCSAPSDGIVDGREITKHVLSTLSSIYKRESLVLYKDCKWQ